SVSRLIEGVSFDKKLSAIRTESDRSIQFPALPARPALCNAAKTSLSLKSPVTSKDFAPLVAVWALTPETAFTASSTDSTHLPQHRCTPLTCRDFTFLPFAPVWSSSLILASLLLPKYPPATNASAAFCSVPV